MDEAIQLQIALLREMTEEFTPSRERSLAATKLDEFEMWLSRCERARKTERPA